MVAVGAALGPGRAVAGLEHGAAVILDQHGLARKHDQKLVLAVVPVALRRPGARVQDYMADAEVGEPRSGSEPAVPASRDLAVEGRRVAGAVDLFDGVEIDPGHELPISKWPWRLEGAFDREIEQRTDEV